MPTQEAIRYLTKSDAAHWFRRSERSLSRDITNAIKLGDQDVLAHVRLRLEDGTVRPGTEITIEEIIRLRDGGQNPTWELEHAWLQSRYGRRGELHREEAEPAEPSPSTVEPREAPAAARELPAEPELRLAVLEAINSELETRNKEKDNHIRRLETELDRRAEERREENELQKQNNVLMQQIYDLLDKMQGSPGELRLLPDSRRARSLPAVAAVEREQVGAVEGEVVPAANPTPSSQQASRAVPTPPRPKKRRAAKRKAVAPKRPTPNSAEPPRTASKPVSRFFPTFDRVARSLFRR
jgi:hypothetical protein